MISLPASLVAARFLANARREAGLSVRALAAEMGIAATNLSRIESGRLMLTAAHIFAAEKGLDAASRRTHGESQLRGECLSGRIDRFLRFLEARGVAIDARRIPIATLVTEGPSWSAQIDEMLELHAATELTHEINHSQSSARVGSLLRELREQAGLSQRALARELGFSQAILSRAEREGAGVDLEKLLVLEHAFVRHGVLRGGGDLFILLSRLLADRGGAA